jgi:hypothetical protein
LIAKILPTKVQGGRAIGTGYPITKDLVLTARHVVFFKDRNLQVPISIEWPDLKNDETGKPYSSIVSEIIQFGEEYDIALLKCDIPLKAHSSLPNLTEQCPAAHDPWESLGYPQIGKYDGKREKASALGFFHPHGGDHIIQLTSESDALEKAGWCGISGAPVFNVNTLYGVISKTPTNRKECFIAVLIPWLITNNPDFCKAIGFSGSLQGTTEQKQQIKDRVNLTPEERCSHLDRENKWQNLMDKRINHQERKAVAFVIAGEHQEWPKALSMSLKIKYLISNNNNARRTILIREDYKDDNPTMQNIWLNFLTTFNDSNPTDNLNIDDTKTKLADELSKSPTSVCFTISLNTILRTVLL